MRHAAHEGVEDREVKFAAADSSAIHSNPNLLLMNYDLKSLAERQLADYDARDPGRMFEGVAPVASQAEAYQLQMKVASQPADAARIIFEAATTKTPRLRWLVGEDAKRLDAGRRRITDEEHIAGARPMDDAQYVEEMKRRFGFDWQ